MKCELVDFRGNSVKLLTGGLVERGAEAAVPASVLVFVLFSHL